MDPYILSGRAGNHCAGAFRPDCKPVRRELREKEKKDKKFEKMLDNPVRLCYTLEAVESTGH